MRRTLIALVLALGTLACGGDDDSDAAQTSSTTTEPPTATVTVRIIAQKSGFGCTQATGRSGLDIGRGSSGRILADGTVAATGVYDITSGAEVCDWTIKFDDVPGDAAIYEVQDSKGALVATIEGDTLEADAWRTNLVMSVLGDVGPAGR